MPTPILFLEQKDGSAANWQLYLPEQGHTVIKAHSRLENRESVEAEIVAANPDFVINAAGKTGRPNVDWCEDHKQEVIRLKYYWSINTCRSLL